ncbi:MAG TPA: alpha/beta hydrolase [Anaerolineales bacterium]|nr:alpha/beta hydrolase [Anaerolineales bacterium]
MINPLSPSSPVPSFDLGSTGQPLHFLHANGYPPECYKPLLERLQTQYYVFGMRLRPLWPSSDPNDIEDWKSFSEDLLQFLASQTTPLIGVGHSIGAIVTLRAALRDPGKFRALVLIDPVLFVPSFMMRWHFVRMLGLGDRLHPLIPGAKKRRRSFDNLESVYRGYRNRQVFRYMSDENLRTYIEGITRKTEDGSYELVYSPDWEAQIYRTGMQDFDIWRGLPNLKVPTLFIRGAETDTFFESAAKFVKRKQPQARIETLPNSTHLLPLERPPEVFDIMQSFLQETLKIFPENSQQSITAETSKV